MTNNVQTPGGNTTTAGAVEQLADRIADKMYPRTHPGWIGGQACALAAIIETTEAAAKVAEDRYLETDWQEPGQCIAAAIRSGYHYGKDET
jgi:hypothetical protein